jgi:hypothetical protein
MGLVAVVVGSAVEVGAPAVVAREGGGERWTRENAQIWRLRM